MGHDRLEYRLVAVGGPPRVAAASVPIANVAILSFAVTARDDYALSGPHV